MDFAIPICTGHNYQGSSAVATVPEMFELLTYGNGAYLSRQAAKVLEDEGEGTTFLRGAQTAGADGIVEDVITALSRKRDLFVVARNSSFAYRGQNVDIRQIGRELGVRYILEGGVRRAGNRLRLTTHLVDTDTASQIWAERFDRELEDIFDLQDEITRNVVASVAPQIEMAEMDRVREVCSAALSLRAAKNVRVRQPLASLTVAGADAATTARRGPGEGLPTGPLRHPGRDRERGLRHR